MTLEPPKDFDDLRRASARIGADPLLIQAAGGNTSVREGGAMRIKASGAPLAEALTRDVFVPVDLAAMREALNAGAPSADRPSEFLLSPSPLRPSVETCLNAVFPERVVLHAHCVNTIALAIRADARERLAERLDGFAWIFQPYIKPGAPLANAVSRALAPGVDVVVLGNHGVIVADDTVGEAERLLHRVAAAVSAPPAEAGRPALEGLAAAAGDGYRPLEADHPLHGGRPVAEASPGRLRRRLLSGPRRLLRRRRDGPRAGRDGRRGRRYRAGGWYAPAGVDLAVFGERGWR